MFQKPFDESLSFLSQHSSYRKMTFYIITGVALKDFALLLDEQKDQRRHVLTCNDIYILCKGGVYFLI